MADKSFGLKQINMIGVGTPTVESPTDLIVNTNGSERVRINSSGNIGIGTNNPLSKLDLRVNTNDVTTGSPNSDSLLQIRGDDATVGNGPSLVLSNFGGSKETAWRISAVSTSGNNGDLVFNGYAGGATYPEAARFTSAGNLKFPSGQGIDFSATADGGTSTPSELLDDYEEGTFTPSFIAGTVSGGYTRQVGEYTKVGRLVTFILTVDGDGNLQGAAQALQIGGLPFTSRNVSEVGGAQVSYPGNFDTTNDRRFWLVSQNSTTLSYRSATAAQINGNLVNNVNSDIVLYGHYYTDS